MAATILSLHDETQMSASPKGTFWKDAHPLCALAPLFWIAFPTVFAFGKNVHHREEKGRDALYSQAL